MRICLLQETVDLLQKELGESLLQMKVEGLVVGVFFTGVKLSGKFFGMARTPIEELPEAVCCPGSARRMPHAGSLRKENVSDLIQWALEPNVLKAAVGVATVNTLSHCLWETKGLPGRRIVEGQDAFDLLDFTKVKRVALIGAFGPYIRRLQVAVVGPTASMVPEPFFKRGVSLIGGLKITDADSTLRVLAEGGSGHHIAGKYGEKIAFLPSE